MNFKFVEEFEVAIANFFRAPYSIAVDSCTHALELCLRYTKPEKISIDYAIIEKAATVAMIESTFDWDDVGEWLAIPRHHSADADGNCFAGTVRALSANENLVINRKEGHLIALLGVDDLVVVHTEDATLVCRKEQAQQIKSLVKSLSEDSQLNLFT